MTEMRTVVFSTDPPYYDNIGYADLSDFFYVWLRRALSDYLPATVQHAARSEEAGAGRYPYRFDGNKERAHKSFSKRALEEPSRACGQRKKTDYPLTVYYAFKQAEDRRR